MSSDASRTDASRSRVVIFDLDGTLIPGQSQKLLLTHLRRSGQIGLVPYLRMIFWFVWYKAGLVKSPARAMDYAVSFLKGRSAREFYHQAALFADEQIIPLISPEALQLIQHHRDCGDVLLLASNSLDPVVKQAARRLDFNRYIATMLEIRQGRFTGKLNGLPVYGGAKGEAIRKLLANSGLSLEQSIAYCDHESDLPVFAMVMEPVAVNPTPQLARIAEEKGWRVLNL